MKFLITLSLAAFSVGAFAQQDLNAMKSKANEHIDKKMGSLQEAKTCVNNAGSIDKFKACKYDMHDDMKKMKAQMMEEKRNEATEE